MSEAHYWQRISAARLARRRLIAGASAAAASFALAACGPGGQEAEPTASRGPSLLGQPQDTTANAKQGGTLRAVALTDVPSFDPHSATSTIVHTQVAAYTYPRLFKFITTRHPERPRGDVEGDLAESFEFTPDRMQVTFRLRQGLRWDNKGPVSGRAIEASDVAASWNRFLRLSPYKSDIAYDAALAPGSPVESMTTPDARTVVFKLKNLDSSILALFASDRLFYVLPREADAGFDPRFEQRGYGPYRLSENRPGSFRTWTRNPDYYVKGRPFIDTIEQPIAGDYASRLAQFKAGNIWTHVASQGDVVSVKREMPALSLMKADNFATNPSSLAFGYEGDSPWKDERLRQAVSLLIDRETLIDVHSNRGRFWAEGLEFDVRYHTAVGAGWDGYWTDPRYEGSFGPSTKFFRYDPGDARKLMTAAGFADGIDSAFHYNGGGQYGGMYARTVELISGMLAAGDIRLRLEPHDFVSDWLPNYHFAYAGVQNFGRQIKGFNGLVYRVASQFPSPATQLFAQMHKDGTRFEGMTPDGRNAHLGDPEINTALLNLRREFDVKRRQEMAQDFSRLMARKSYVIPNLPFSSLGYTLTWPAIANAGVYHGWPVGAQTTEAGLNLWIDTTKPPVAPA